jgi:hypothetical protein
MCLKQEYVENEAKKGFKDWSKEGWEFFLQNTQYKEIAICTLAKILEHHDAVEFIYNALHYEIFKSSETGYVINVYSSNRKNTQGEYLQENLIDDGVCTGSAKDAIEFML